MSWAGIRWRRDFRPGIQYHGQINISHVFDHSPTPIINVKPYQPGKFHVWFSRPWARFFLTLGLLYFFVSQTYKRYVWQHDAPNFLALANSVQRFCDWWNERAHDSGSWLQVFASRITLGHRRNSDLDILEPMEKAFLLRARVDDHILDRAIFDDNFVHPERRFRVEHPPDGSVERQLMRSLAGHTLEGPYGGNGGAAGPVTHYNVEELKRAERGETLERTPYGNHQRKFPSDYSVGMSRLNPLANMSLTVPRSRREAEQWYPATPSAPVKPMPDTSVDPEAAAYMRDAERVRDQLYESLPQPPPEAVSPSRRSGTAQFLERLHNGAKN
eukprot:TRINITY_DN9534_c0_g1_i1.p1 TRINITY_DN9534_c0_g1~~TRINITY_DN9534_c0_g1_i1.p1  ORF type:complete len:329 (+),score=31.28 TRINITY_DN9534_c0_g1_i1:91-1077(+)